MVIESLEERQPTYAGVGALAGMLAACVRGRLRPLLTPLQYKTGYIEADHLAISRKNQVA